MSGLFGIEVGLDVGLCRGAFGKGGLCLARGIEQGTLCEYLLRGSVDLVEVPPTDTPVELLASFGSIFDRPPSYCFTLLQCIV